MRSLSVAMATYNGAKYLPNQLGSLASQNFLPDELVICDDVSSDNTVAILNDFASQAPFPVFIVENSHRLGWRRNFLQAASRCRSNTIAFCDQDDEWKDNKTVICMEALDKHDALLAFHNADVFGEGIISAKKHLDLGNSRIFQQGDYNPLWFVPPGFSLVFRRTVLRHLRLWEYSIDANAPNQKAGHDQWIFFLASILGRVIYINHCLVRYRQHEQNAIGSRPSHTKSSHGTTQVAHLERMARNLANRRDIIMQLSQIEHSDQIQAIAERSETQLSRLGRSIRIHQSSTLKARISLLFENLFEGAYSAHQWGLGRRQLLRDAACVFSAVTSKRDGLGASNRRNR